MLLKQIFKSLAGVQKRVNFENSHAKDGWRYVSVLCTPEGEPIPELAAKTFDFRKPHAYRIEKFKPSLAARTKRYHEHMAEKYESNSFAVWKYETTNSPWPLFLTATGSWSRKLAEAERFDRETADRLAQEHKGGTHQIR